MNCELCNLEIVEPGATSPCCNRRFHTICLVKYTTAVAMDHYHINCPCGIDLYVMPQSNHMATAELPTSTEALEEIKRIKVMAKKARKDRLALSKILREEKQVFKNATEPHITAIKHMIKAQKASVISTGAYKDYRKSSLAYINKRRAFRTKHDLDWYGMRSIFGNPYDINTRGLHILNRNFRVRL